MSKQHHLLLIFSVCAYFTHSMNFASQTTDSIDLTNIINQQIPDSGLTQDQINAIEALAHQNFQTQLDEASHNILEDINVIKVAASLTGSLETIDKILKIAGIEQAHTILKQIKYAARINVLHKLIMGATPGKFAKTPLYTSATTESIGFTLNNLVLTTMTELIAKTKFGAWMVQNLYLNDMPESAQWITKNLFVGILTHLIWTGQKALWELSRGKTA